MRDFSEVESDWVDWVRKKFEPPDDVELSYKDENNFLWLVNAPGQYEVEEKMLAYAKEHPEASKEELIDYFDRIVPDGLPPCAVGWDDDDDDE